MSNEKMKFGTNRDTPQAVAKLMSGNAGAKKRFQINVDAEIHKAFKMACIEDETEMSDVIIELVENWLRERGAK